MVDLTILWQPYSITISAMGLKMMKSNSLHLFVNSLCLWKGMMKAKESSHFRLLMTIRMEK